MVSWLRANGKTLFRGAALLLAGAAAGFGLGLFFAVPAGPGCQESDLTPVPDTGFVSPAPEAAPASALPQEEPIPEKWVCFIGCILTAKIAIFVLILKSRNRKS